LAAIHWTFEGTWPYEANWFDDGRMHYVDEGPRNGRPVDAYELIVPELIRFLKRAEEQAGPR
jgi:hypothetical protein